MSDRQHCDACDDPGCQGFSLAQRQCLCPDHNDDCAHPACPRWPQSGHLARHDPARCPYCGNPADVCFCEEIPRRRPLRLNKPRTQADDDRAAGRKWWR